MANDGGRLNTPGRPSKRRATNGNSLDRRIGPFYDTNTVAALLGVSRSTVYRRIVRRELLGLKTADNQHLFPISQFNEMGQPPTGLRDVLLALDPHLEDSWGDALWLLTSASALGGARPIDRINRGDLDDVLPIARRIGATLVGRLAPR